MGDARFLYNNLISTESMLSVSSLRTGIVTDAKKDGAGSAVISTGGSYSGTTDLEYIVEIDSIAGGAEVGQATFRWSDGGGTWDATGVTTSATPTTLNNGVTVAWTTGSGADFVVGDAWYFKGVNLFNAGKMIDWDRDHRYRSLTLSSPNTITADFGVAKSVEALVLFDHNFTSAATITLWADDAATFDSDGGSPQFTESVTWTVDKIIHYLSVATSKRYWRVRITDTTNPDGFLEIGEWFLGTYTELSRNYDEGFERSIPLLLQAEQTVQGVLKRRFFNKQRRFRMVFSALTASDLTNLETLVDTIVDKSAQQINPFFFHEDSANNVKIWMVNLSELPEVHQTLSVYQSVLEMLEVPTSI